MLSLQTLQRHFVDFFWGGDVRPGSYHSTMFELDADVANSDVGMLNLAV